ncbi:type IV toxin-antitoxin system AbiEi family antitoxin domain-containing protein [Sediminispirochaeta bajacaliforniensis]|uniref:type IV toxin-antitoxin system AbiEi family antitoxin domain-containing protein n=1 Tax=Sediminispirochaeta bajacaliforniensis TaxID=148 RepID=UPI0008A2F49F|nr:type IV toxin-antitoxin system AbiEi family antitoxin domain-containing protein [Sediminispirochaeta bajacaliforniensis]
MTQRDIAKQLLSNNSIVSSRELADSGVHRETIRRLIESGEMIRIARGLYSSPQFIPAEKYSLIVAQKTVKRGVVCLMSALSFHEIGTQNPSEVWMAISRPGRIPTVDNIPMKVITFSGASFTEGIETHQIDDDEIKVYCISKTVADCFKYRNKIGLDVAIEALKDVIQNKRTSIEEIIHYAEVCRVRKIMRPYMESIV